MGNGIPSEFEKLRWSHGSTCLVSVTVRGSPPCHNHGRVLIISPVAVAQQGDTTYTLTIELEHTDLNLRPGMTVQLDIQTG